MKQGKCPVTRSKIAEETGVSWKNRCTYDFHRKILPLADFFVTLLCWFYFLLKRVSMICIPFLGQTKRLYLFPLLKSRGDVESRKIPRFDLLYKNYCSVHNISNMMIAVFKQKLLLAFFDTKIRPQHFFSSKFRDTDWIPPGEDIQNCYSDYVIIS